MLRGVGVQPKAVVRKKSNTINLNIYIHTHTHIVFSTIFQNIVYCFVYIVVLKNIKNIDILKTNYKIEKLYFFLCVSFEKLTNISEYLKMKRG